MENREGWENKKKVINGTNKKITKIERLIKCKID
jgi:hypothetical protein